MKLIETDSIKSLRSHDVNYIFDKKTGLMMTWGKTKEENPVWSPYGPFILDMEITTICDRGCSFCYKSNTKNGVNMSFDAFKTILGKVGKCLTQIAFGADQSGTANPDLFRMMDYSRSIGVIPNITIANISDDTAKRLAEVCGAVAVSRYAKKDDCYNSIEKLVKYGAKQVNIHQMVSKETLKEVYETINDIKNDKRLQGLNALVFLSLKKKGRGSKFNNLTQQEFSELIEFTESSNVSIGMDSCSAGFYINTIKNRVNFKQLEEMVEPCESSLFSAYIDVHGKYYPCSFCEEHESFKEGIDVVSCDNFLDVWLDSKTNIWRDKLIQLKSNGNLNCPIYDM